MPEAHPPRRRDLRSGAAWFADNRVDTQKVNPPEENLNFRGPRESGYVRLATGVLGSSVQVLLAAWSKILLCFRGKVGGQAATSSRRRARSQAHDMHALSPRTHQAQLPFGLSIGRFGFASANRPNRKPPHGSRSLVDLVNLVCLFRGCMCVRERARARARSRASPSLPPDRTDQIDQIDQTPPQYCGYHLVDCETADQITDQTEVAR